MKIKILNSFVLILGALYFSLSALVKNSPLLLHPILRFKF